MRMRVNRLVYVLMGAALVVGLLVSVFERPESQARRFRGLLWDLRVRDGAVAV